MSVLQDPSFWISVLQIIWINILLSGDNALVIALACRNLPERQKLWGMVLGAGAAVVLRILFTGIVTSLMEIPYLKVIGGALLLWVAVKLVVPGGDGEDEEPDAAETLFRAVKIVVIADIVMSLDNVIAIAAAVKGDTLLMAIGLAISVPLIVAGAALVMWLLQKLPILLWAGAGLLGWIAGEIIDEDPGLAALVGPDALPDVMWASAVGAAFVLVVAFVLSRLGARAAANAEAAAPKAG